MEALEVASVAVAPAGFLTRLYRQLTSQSPP
jgi:hypothetical protein